MEWNDVKEIKPDRDIVCYVYNCRWGGAFQAIYHKSDDVFVQYDPKMHDHPCLDVTHWIELPHPKHIPHRKQQ